jgi:hypothetical protein
MHTALLHRSKRLWLLVSTLLVLVQPAASAEGNTRKVGIVTVISVDAASRSPAFKRFTDAIRASVPGLTSLGPDGADNLQHVTRYIGKILNGANPADLPVERSLESENLGGGCYAY